MSAGPLRAVLVDIEGTVAPIRFVKETLFPFARARLAAFVDAHRAQPEVAGVLAETARLTGLAPDDLRGLIAALERWSDEDRKIGPLKTLQGLIWEEGYRAGALRSTIFPDAVRALRAWAAAGVVLAVYSSGSALAQRLLFGATDAGDLRPLFRDFFDTAIGAKQEPQSYGRIAARLRLPPAEILFLSDVAAELDAAAAAGMATTQLVRPGEDAIGNGRHRAIASFDELQMNIPSPARHP
jgi:enolase-phosphatase E1